MTSVTNHKQTASCTAVEAVQALRKFDPDTQNGQITTIIDCGGGTIEGNSYTTEVIGWEEACTTSGLWPLSV
jgi:hypothetical protein